MCPLLIMRDMAPKGAQILAQPGIYILSGHCMNMTRNIKNEILFSIEK